MKREEASTKAREKAVSGREIACANVLCPDHCWCFSSSMEANGVPSSKKKKSREGEMREQWKAGWDIRGQYRVSRIMQTVLQWSKRLSWHMLLMKPSWWEGKQTLWGDRREN